MSVGIDLIHKDRAKRLMENPEEYALIFVESELHNISNNIERATGCIALKEAYMKAIGKKMNWHSVVVHHEESGAPYLVVGEENISSVSVSHDGDYVVAVVILS